MTRFFKRRPREEPVVETPPVVSPAVSRVSSLSPFPVATPGAVSESAGDYFEPLSEIPSTRSHLSVPGQGYGHPPQRLNERPYLEGRRGAPSIRLRRRVSNNSIDSSNRNSLVSNDGFFDGNSAWDSNRQRSISQPERARVHDGPPIAMHSARVPQIALPRLTEEGGRPSLAELGVSQNSWASPVPTSPLSPSMSLPDQRSSQVEQHAQKSRRQRARNISRAFWPPYHRHNKQQETHQGGQSDLDPLDPNNKLEYAQDLVDWLDTIDPEVQTLSTLTNVQNSLFIPDLGNWLNRRPTYVLSEHDPQSRWAKGALEEERRQEQLAREPTIIEPTAPQIQRSNTISSRLTDSHYAALPHGTNLEGWTAEEKAELDDHVRHMLHSRRARFKRQLKGFGQYVKRPLGFFVTLYATLITLFGLAWVLFLIGWIYVGEKQVYAIHIIDSVLVALFAIMGDGLAPFRAVDTYHMIYIARYSRMINNAKKGKKPRARLQKKRVPYEVREEMERAAWEEEQRRMFPGFTQDGTENRGSQEPLTDLENPHTEFDPSWLTPKQQKNFEHHQAKLAKSHSFYKPYETFTHNAFPLGYLIAIVVLLDFHSCLQISLGACTWGIDYHVRPFALTTVILCVSITCNVTAGLVITIGDRKTRKKDVVKLMDRQELTGDAIKHMEEKKKKEQEKEDSSNPESPRESGVLGSVLSKETSLDSGKEKGRTKLVKDPSSSSSS